VKCSPDKFSLEDFCDPLAAIKGFRAELRVFRGVTVLKLL
jgi:hypothetical protein